MKSHIKIYINFFNFDISDVLIDEIWGTVAVDIHHINSRGMGGTTKEDTIDNLMALDSLSHLFYGDKTKYLEFLNIVHKSYINKRIPYIKINPTHNAILDMVNEYPNYKMHWRKYKKKNNEHISNRSSYLNGICS